MKLRELISSSLPRAARGRKRSSSKRRSKHCSAKSTQTSHEHVTTPEGVVDGSGLCEPRSSDGRGIVRPEVLFSEHSLHQDGAVMRQKTGGGVCYEHFATRVTDPASNDSHCDVEASNSLTIMPGRSMIRTNPWLPSPAASPRSSGVVTPMTSSAASSESNDDSNRNSLEYDITTTTTAPKVVTVFSPTLSMTESGFYSCGTPDTDVTTTTPFDKTLFEQSKNFGFDRLNAVSSFCDTDDVISDNESEATSPVFDYEHEFESKLDTLIPAELWRSQETFDFESQSNQALTETTTDASGRRLRDGFAAASTGSLLSSDFELDDDTNYDELYGDIRDDYMQYVHENNNHSSSKFELTAEAVLNTQRGGSRRSDVTSSSHKQDSAIINSSQYNFAACNYECVNDVLLPLGKKREGDRIKFLQYLDSQAMSQRRDDVTTHTPTTTSSYSAKDYNQYLLERKATPFDSIRRDLRTNIRQLRHEQVLIDRFVELERAEQARAHELRMLSQQQTNLEHKRLLLETLRDLRAKLDEQTERLQTSYERIIAFQYEAARSRHGH